MIVEPNPSDEERSTTIKEGKADKATRRGDRKKVVRGSKSAEVC